MGTSRMPSFLDEASGYLSSPHADAAPYTAREYFTALLGQAIHATEDGDYGISAALVRRYPDTELISLARNTLISAGDPLGHAETNAIRQFRAFRDLSPDARARTALPWTGPVPAAMSSGGVYARPAPGDTGPGEEAVLFTTLEPCPMCTVAILNSGITAVVIAVPDEEGGALAPGHLARLPAIFGQVAASQRLRVTFTSDSRESDPGTFVPPPLSVLLERAFLDTKQDRDARLAKGILFRPGT